MDAKTFSKFLYAEMGLLVVQFLLGMYVNLYINIPTTLTTSFWEAASTPLVIAHMWVGTALLGVAIYLALRSGAAINPAARWAAYSGLFWVAFAFASGIAFLFGGADNVYSYLMSAGFLFAVMSYGFAAGATTFRSRTA